MLTFLKATRGLRGLALWLLLLGAPLAASAEEFRARVLILGNDTVRPGLLHEFEQLGAARDLQVTTGMVEELPVDADPTISQHQDLAILFAPGHALPQTEALAALRADLAERQIPLVVVHRDRFEAERLPQDQAEPIADYLTEGGMANFEALFQYLTGPLWQHHSDPVPEPQAYPERGIYHPDYSGLVFSGLDAYRYWYGDFGDRPVIGIAVHDSQIRQTLTGWIDTTVERLEAAGAVPVPFFVPVRDEGGMRALVAPQGQSALDALLFYRVTLNPEGRAEDFAHLGIPVLQGMIYRDGSEADWRADPVGFARGSTPFYFTMAEMAGITDPTVVAAEREGDEQVVAIQPELDALIQRALNWVGLSRKANAEKRLGVYIYNYPQGDSNFSASNLNVPESLAAMFEDLAAAGYDLEVPEVGAITEAGKLLVSAYYYGADRDALLSEGLAALFPLSDYKDWLDSRAEGLRQRVEAEWGTPEQAATLIERDGEHYFVIPRLKLGQIALLPQPPRALKEDPNRSGAYHDTDLPFSHDYLASYAYLHRGHSADAVIHFGTHGSAEFGAGKTRGLALDDDPHAALGELPHVYPYIVDNLAESTLAKRRMRATIVSHQTPPFAPSALYHELVDLHDLVHDWQSMDDGATRDRVKAQIVELSKELSLHADLGIEDERVANDFSHYLHQLHHYIHAMAQQSEPIGLHTLGRSGKDRHLLATVMQMLGEDYYALSAEDPHEVFVGDFDTAVTESEPYQLLEQHLQGGEPLPESMDGGLRRLLDQGKRYLDDLRNQQETAAIIQALDGGYIEPSVGGDPLRNPDSLPTGRNLYGFDPSRVPSKAAYETGVELMQGLIADHTETHGEPPERLAFTLWAMEVMRHQGVIEGQVFTALGVKPVWNDRGRLEGVELISREALGRPRVDVVLQASGLYRDAFAGTLELLAEAAALAAEQEEPDNPVRAMTQQLTEQLQQAGLDSDAVHRLSRTRAFSSDIGQYGIGLDDGVADVDAWSEGDQLDDAYLGRIFLDRLQHAYGPDADYWGETLPGINLFERHLATTDAAVFARSSNLYGLLSSDDPFQYLGGLSLGVQVAGGQRPDLYISNLRDPSQGRMERADQFLSREVRTRYHHPRWLQSMVDEGYSGTTTLQDTIENLWGWQAVAPEMVRDDQWQRFFEIYAQDDYELGLEEWFEDHNPQALTRIMERMLDAVRTGHWQASDETLEALLEQYSQWSEQHGQGGASVPRVEFVADAMAGFGMGAPTQADAGGEPVTVQGQVMTPAAETSEPEGAPDWRSAYYLAVLLILFVLGGAHQHWRARRGSPTL